MFEPVAREDLHYHADGKSVALVGDYRSFLGEFGLAKLFTDHRDAPVVSVYPLKGFRRHVCLDGSTFIGFGFRGQQSVYFDESAIVSGLPSKVYLVTKKCGRELSESFSDWLLQAYQWANGKYSASQWNRIVAGPPPFNSEELSIVHARSKFKWSHAGFAENGDAIFKIENLATRTIPYLTLGIRDRAGTVLEGAVWLDVGHIGPGMTGLVSKDCYKDRVASDQLVPFDLPEPIPEKRERYWEFGPPK